MIVISIAGVIILLVILGVLIFAGPVALGSLISAMKGHDPFDGFGAGLERVFVTFWTRLWVWLALCVLIVGALLIWPIVGSQG